MIQPIQSIREQIYKPTRRQRIMTMLRRIQLQWQLLVILALVIVLLWGGYFAESAFIRKLLGFENKTVWDWMGLIIIPVVLGWAARVINAATQERERMIAEDRRQEEILQQYLDFMGKLMIEHDLVNLKPNAPSASNAAPDSLTETQKALRNLARTQTLIVFQRLKPIHKSIVLQFLAQAELVNGANRGAVVIELSAADLEGVEMWGGSLQGNTLSGGRFKNARLQSIHLELTLMIQCDFQGASLRNCILFGANWTSCDMQNVDLTYARLGEGPVQLGTNSAQVGGMNLGECNLKGANLSYADLRGTRLFWSNLVDVNLTGAIFSPTTTLPDGVLWTADTDMRQYTDPNHPNFWRGYKANLGQKLRQADLGRANFRSANLFRADFEDADLTHANLIGVDLSEANLVGASLSTVRCDTTTRLPDGTNWTDAVDWGRFTDPQHPQFWRSEYPESPAYKGRPVQRQ